MKFLISKFLLETDNDEVGNDVHIAIKGNAFNLCDYTFYSHAHVFQGKALVEIIKEICDV